MNIILHCSKSSYGNAAIITTWHIKRGWRNIGYHFVILNGKTGHSCEIKSFNGHIETGRLLNEKGAHTLNHNNDIGVCLIGQSNSFTSEQIESCHNLIKMLKIKYDIKEVHQHSEYSDEKSFCAGFNKDMMERFNA